MNAPRPDSQVMSLVLTGTKNHCSGENQQQFNKWSVESRVNLQLQLRVCECHQVGEFFSWIGIVVNKTVIK
jgi:hypothetical protein